MRCENLYVLKKKIHFYTHSILRFIFFMFDMYSFQRPSGLSLFPRVRLFVKIKRKEKYTRSHTSLERGSCRIQTWDTIRSADIYCNNRLWLANSYGTYCGVPGLSPAYHTHTHTHSLVGSLFYIIYIYHHGYAFCKVLHLTLINLAQYIYRE